MKKRDHALKKSLSTKLHTDTLIYKGLRNRVVTELRKAKTNYFMQLINDSGGNSSYLWKHINTLLNRKPKRHGEIKELNIKGTISTNIKEIANELNSYFIQSVDELTSNFEKTFSTDELNSDSQQR